jgi:hypothetical protein
MSAAGSVCRLHVPARMRVVIECYFDDSGKESELSHRYVVIAGYMAGASWPWERFSQYWRHLLIKHELPYVHMREILGFAKKRGWDSAKLTDVLRDFIGAIKASDLIGLGIGIDANEWRALSSARRKILGNAQEFCCSRILRRIVDRLVDSGFPDEPLSITFDRDWDFARERLKLIEQVSKFAPSIRKNLAQLSFADSKVFYPLQAADLLAWETRRQLVNRLEGKPPTSRWTELTTAWPYGELDYAAGEFWDKEMIEREIPKAEAENEARRLAAKAIA